jgi:hypothetical protein
VLATPDLLHPEWSPMMRLDGSAPTLVVSLLVDPGGHYDPTHHWVSAHGRLCCSVAFNAGGFSRGAIQGAPEAMRELAAALIAAAELADQDFAPPVAEGVAR